MASEIKVDTVSEKTSGSGVTIDGLLIKDGGISGDVSLIGTTPTFTIGDAGAEDAALVFDGNAQDFYIALDDSADDLLIGLGSTVGTTAAVSIDENLQVKIVATTASTSATTGSLIAAGGAGIAADLHVGDDVTLISDSAVLGFGADKDTTLTHTDGTGLTLNSTNKLCFNDASQFVQGSSATVLSIGATDEIDLTATAIDINGTCDISGTFSLAGTNVTSTAAELNIMDGGTSATSTTLADADRVVVNDAGTMKQVAMTDVKTYMGGGGLVPISTIALSAAAQVNMASVFSDTYLNYFLVLSMIKVAGDNSLDIQFGTGGSYDGGNHYGWTNHFMINNGTNGASVSDSATSNKIRLIPDIDADSEAGASGQFIITNPKGGYQRKHISGTAAVQKTTAGNTAIVNTAGTFHESTTQNFTDIRFLTGDGGNFTAGSTSGGYGMIQLFGIVNS
jgi:hypothetical protein